MRRISLTLVISALVAAITMSTAAPVLAGGGGGSICEGFSRGDRISMYDSCFAGTAQLVDPATDTVTVTNDGAITHTITAVDGSFDLSLASGETASLDLPDDAVLPVYCTLHGTTDGTGMAGVIVWHGDTGTTAAAEETVAAANIAPLDASSGEEAGGASSSERAGGGVAVVALIVAGVAAALAFVTVVALITRFRTRGAR